MLIMTLEVNRKCNFLCKYCYIKNKLDYEMSRETAVKSIDWAVQRLLKDNHKKKSIEIDFLGGEPLLSFKLIKGTIEYIKEKYTEIEFTYSITTNGSLLNQDIISFLIKHSFFIKVSLDGKEEDNDKNRLSLSGVGTYRSVIDKFKYLNIYQEELKRGVQVNSVVTKNNYLNYASNLIYLVEVLGFRSIDLGINLEDEWSYNDLSSLKMVMLEALEYYLKKNLSETFFSWTFIEKVYNNYNRRNGRRLLWCGAGVSSFYISWDGNIFMCPACMSDEYSIGTVDCDLCGEWYKVINENKKLIDINNPQCIECEYTDYCPTKGCFVKNHNANKTIHKPYELSCVITKMSAEMYQSHKSEIDAIMRRRNEYK